mmetsp:Transcript_56570/g.106128  ORF Transcript_56570/g.106128 Transcript_56570/m.106128 type:complete len:91 (-) Transcript_56570:217-489(-)
MRPSALPSHQRSLVLVCAHSSHDRLSGLRRSGAASMRMSSGGAVALHVVLSLLLHLLDAEMHLNEALESSPLLGMVKSGLDPMWQIRLRT